MLLKIYMAILLVLTLAIPFRRFLWDQVPTQVGPAGVWLTVALNLVILAWLTRRFLSVRLRSKNQ